MPDDDPNRRFRAIRRRLELGAAEPPAGEERRRYEALSAAYAMLDEALISADDGTSAYARAARGARLAFAGVETAAGFGAMASRIHERIGEREEAVRLLIAAGDECMAGGAPLSASPLYVRAIDLGCTDPAVSSRMREAIGACVAAVDAAFTLGEQRQLDAGYQEDVAWWRKAAAR